MTQDMAVGQGRGNSKGKTSLCGYPTRTARPCATRSPGGSGDCGAKTWVLCSRDTWARKLEPLLEGRRDTVRLRDAPGHPRRGEQAPGWATQNPWDAP